MEKQQTVQTSHSLSSRDNIPELFEDYIGLLNECKPRPPQAPQSLVACRRMLVPTLFVALLGAASASAHATFQEFWVNGGMYLVTSNYKLELD